MNVIVRRSRATTLLLTLALGGCTSLREIPRRAYTALPERRDVRVETLDGRRFEFDVVHIGEDSLTGYRRRDAGGHFPEYDAVPLTLAEVGAMSGRRTDWYRTGLAALAAVAGVLIVVLTVTERDEPADPGGGGRPPPVGGH